VVAAEALARHGAERDLAAALEVLVAAADPTRTSAYAATFALNAIDELDAKAAPIREELREQPLEDPEAPGRANEYVKRVRDKIEADFAPR
jgi:hypothetical protein